MKPVVWPDGKKFAFTIFDDPDSQSWDGGRAVYGALREMGFRTTKAVWPLGPIREASDEGLTCAAPGYVEWVRELVAAGFEAGYHCATSHTCYREESRLGLERFEEYFGAPPKTAANHYFCDENLYWGEDRLSGWRRAAYNLLTRYGHSGKYHGHHPGHAMFWGDLAQQKITYLRNFVFSDVNCFNTCPYFPYHDPARPYVNYWYCAAEGSNYGNFMRTLTNDAMDRLEDEGGLCIMYTHFGHQYYENGRVQPDFLRRMERLAGKSGWFAPTGTILDYVRQQRGGGHQMSPAERAALERRWLWHKVRYGSA